jgi:hypothetical protein
MASGALAVRDEKTSLFGHADIFGTGISVGAEHLHMATNTLLFLGCPQTDIHGTETAIVTVTILIADRTLTHGAFEHLALTGLPVAFTSGAGESIIAQVNLIGAESANTDVFGAGIIVITVLV